MIGKLPPKHAMKSWPCLTNTKLESRRPSLWSNKTTSWRFIANKYFLIIIGDIFCYFFITHSLLLNKGKKESGCENLKVLKKFSKAPSVNVSWSQNKKHFRFRLRPGIYCQDLTKDGSGSSNWIGNRKVLLDPGGSWDKQINLGPNSKHPVSPM